MNADFLFGVSSAATQIEGGAFKDNKNKSIWDLYEEKNKIDNGKISTACDSYHRYKEDIDLVKELGCNVYRFSINWNRIVIFIDDKQVVNPLGIKFYNNMINYCIEQKITPFITLYHWDLPIQLYEKDGYLNSNFPKVFEEYVKIAISAFGDRVKNWFTFNEPQNLLTPLGGSDKKYTPKEYFQMLHNILLAHGLAYRAIKSYDKNINVSIAYAVEGIVPFSSSLEDKQAALKRQFGVAKNIPFCLSLWMDPVLKGDYPSDYYLLNKDNVANINKDDLDIIHTGLDFIGINEYTGFLIKSDGKGDCIEVPWPSDTPKTKNGEWFFVPKTLYFALKNIFERYNVPIIISENGGCVPDVLEGNFIHDKMRCTIVNSFVTEVYNAINDGIDIKGYFVWSLLDNLEWFRGTTQRFGLVYIDFANFKRIKKDSFYAYKEIIRHYRH